MVHCNKRLDFYGAAHIIPPLTVGGGNAAEVRQEIIMANTPKFEDIQDFSKQQLEAMATASSTWTKGWQELAAESTDYSKKAFAAGSAVFEKMLGARSLEAAIQIQSDYAKEAYEGFVSQASKVSELCAKVASDALKPVTSAYSTFQVK